MATVTHIIRSHYDPADRENLERATGQRSNSSDPWQTESSFSAQRRIRAAPTFVPATILYDEWGTPLSPTTAPEKPEQRSRSTAEWYRSTTATSGSPSTLPRPSSAPPPGPVVQVDEEASLSQPRRRPESVTKGNWFISKALRSEPSTKPSSPAPSLADLLARDPPPLPLEGRYVPPVWLHIGPSNRGFGMLQRSGWNEGEGLGAHIARRVARTTDADERAADVQNGPEVIDLTLSDADVSEAAFGDDIITQELVRAQEYTEGAFAAHTQRSLLTPLPTVLKADRLGIGLKAKTEGPYKQSSKRVTHGAAALAAHTRSAEEMQRTKASVGKGKRGFAKIHRREEERRKAMLAYLND